MKPIGQKITLCLIITALAATLASAQVSFTVASAVANPNTARSSNSQYTIVLNAITSFSTTFDLSVSFTSAFSITSVSGCQALLNGAALPSAQCTASSNSIVFTSLNIASTVSNLTLYFNTTTALYSGSSLTTLTYYQPGNSANTYNSNSALINITNAPMACSLTSSSAIVGATTNYSFSYTPSVSISAGSILQIQFPAWSSYSLTNFPSFLASSVCSGQCTIRSPNTAQSFYSEILTYSSLYSAATSNSNTLTLQNARNPASTQNITLTASLLYYISSTSQPSYMTCTTSFAPTLPNTFTGLTFAPPSTAISATGNVSLLLNLSNPVSSASYLSVTYSPDLQLAFSYVTSNQQTTQLTYSSGQTNTLLIGNLTNATTLFTTLFLATFTLTNAPYATLNNTITFLTQNLVSGTYYSVDSKTISLAATPSLITVATATMSNDSIGVVSNITVTFTTINSLVSGSKIILTLPSEITFSASSTCSCTISSTCTLANSSSLLLNINAVAIGGGTSIPITINYANNPVTTTATSSFAINTYYKNTSTPIDYLTTGLTLTAKPVTLLNAAVTSSSLVVAANSTYTLTAQIRNPLPAGSSLTLTFPSDFPNANSAVLSSFTSGSTLIASCTMSPTSNMNFSLTNCVPNSLPVNTTLKIVINNILNPFSTKPTASLQLKTYYNNLPMEYVNSSVTIAMTTSTPITYSALTPVNTTANSLTNYTLSLTFALQHYSGDRIFLTLPTTITLVSGFQCTSSTSGVSVSCFKTSAQVLSITMTSTSVIGNSLGVVITNVQNNWYSGINSFSIATATNDTTNYYMEQGTANVTLTAAALSAACTTTNALVLLASSTLSVDITSPFQLSPPDPTLVKITLTLPSQFTPTTSCNGSLSGSVCTLSGQTYTLTNLTNFLTTINVTFTATASYFTTTSPFTSKLSYNSSDVATDSTLSITPYCLSPCKSCTSPTSCTSCLPSTYTSLTSLYTPNSSCLASCPSSYYLPTNSSTCAQCSTTACLTCTTTATTCTSCASPAYLMNSSCLLTCPNTYYGSATFCLPCANQCYNCTNATYCLTCVSGYSLNPAHTCLLTCPSNYLSLAGICTPCTSPCATCTASASKCTSCQPGYILYNNTCILTCPLGQYQDTNNLCQNCISPCKYCTTALTCQTCLTGYYIYNTTQCVAICPSGYYPVTTTCTLCSTTCQTCSNIATNCTSCQSGLYYYLNTCYSQCPSPTYPYQGTCTTCVSPCSTCLSGAFSCSTCIATYYLLNTSCVTACPSSGYATINSSCVACPTNCLSCLTSTTCAACLSSYYSYQGGCVSACPSSSPIIVNSVCTSCSPQCATCAQSPDNCLTCTLYYFQYSYTCVQTCPLSYYSNALTYTCESGLSSKIVFFPVLITFAVIIAILILIKSFSCTTSLPTALTAFSGWFELAIWAYLFSLLFATYLEPNINYTIPQTLIALAIATSLTSNFIHFKLNLRKLEEDDYARKWQDINVNHNYFVGIRYIALFTHHKFFRIIYSKLFHSLHLSLVAYRPHNLFFPSTLFTIIALFTSEILILVAAFDLAYNKLLKDQVFYTAVETLIVTVISIVVSLIDIYKPDNYFEDTDFMETKRYLEKVNNDSLNKLEDQYRNRDQGSVDGQKVMGMTGGKFVFSKRGNLDSGSMNEILFQEQSAATDVNDKFKKKMKIKIQDIEMLDDDALNEKTLNEKSINSPKSALSKNSKSPRSPVNSMRSQDFTFKEKETAKINIFEPIQEQEAEYYEVLKYEEEDFKTAAKIEEEKIDANVSEEENQLQQERRNEFGLSQQPNRSDDNMSLLEYRQRREEWNNIINHRQKLAHQIFNTIDTKELYKIDQPLNQDQERQDSPVKQRVFNRTPERTRRRRGANDRQQKQKKLQNLRKQVNQLPRMRQMESEEMIQEEEPRKRRRARKGKKSNKELEEIYLQRLAEKVPDPKRKTMYASSKTFKYDF